MIYLPKLIYLLKMLKVYGKEQEKNLFIFDSLNFCTDRLKFQIGIPKMKN